MRKFTSYGSIDTPLHYHVSRTELIEQTYQKSVGGHPDQGGHDITIWVPRQTARKQ